MPRRTPKVRAKPTDDGVEWGICIVDQTKFISPTYPEPPVPDVVPPEVIARAKAEKLPLPPGRYVLVFWWCGKDEDGGKDVWFTSEEWVHLVIPVTDKEIELRQKYIVDKPPLDKMFPELGEVPNSTTTPIETSVRSSGDVVVEDTTPKQHQEKQHQTLSDLMVPPSPVEDHGQRIFGNIKTGRKDKLMPWSK